MILAKNREIICLEKDCEFLLHIFLPVTPLSPQERDEGIMETREHDLWLQQHELLKSKQEPNSKWCLTSFFFFFWTMEKSEMAMLRTACHSINLWWTRCDHKGRKNCSGRVVKGFFSPKTDTWKNHETQTKCIYVEVCGRTIKRKQAKL